MKPINFGGHSAYQDRVLTGLRKYYPNAANSLSLSTWQTLEKFGSLDLSAIDVLMQDRYSNFGPEPQLPSDMLRSILVSVEFKITSYTRFASDLKENHLHAIISGFHVGDTPGTETFYDFHKRLWLSEDKNLSTPVHPPKVKPQKPNGNEEKAALVEKVTVEDLFCQFEESLPYDMAPCIKLWEIFNTLFFRNLQPIIFYHLKIYLWPVMELLFIQLPRNEKPVPVIAWIKGFVIANATGFIISRIVTLDGIPIAIVFTLGTTYTC